MRGWVAATLLLRFAQLKSAGSSLQVDGSPARTPNQIRHQAGRGQLEHGNPCRAPQGRMSIAMFYGSL
jgi:hypothetical protein